MKMYYKVVLRYPDNDSRYSVFKYNGERVEYRVRRVTVAPYQNWYATGCKLFIFDDLRTACDWAESWRRCLSLVSMPGSALEVWRVLAVDVCTPPPGIQQIAPLHTLMAGHVVLHKRIHEIPLFV